MNIIITIFMFIFALIVAYGIGFLGAKLSKFIENKKIFNNADKFLKGKRPNKIQLDDGRNLDVNKFITFDEHGNKIRIDLKGGINIEKIKDVKKNDRRRILEEKVNIRKDESRSIGKVSRSSGKKKRVIGVRNRILRRFG